jgi:hypothetical protein
VDFYLSSFLNFGLVGFGGQLYETAALLPGKGLPLSAEYEAGWVLEQVCNFGEKIPLTLPRIEKRIFYCCFLYTSTALLFLCPYETS